MKKLLEIKDLSAGYDNQLVLENVSMSILANDFIGVIGPNGGGKTTLIKTILGLVKPLSGEMNLLISKKNIGYLPQVNQIDKRFPITVIDVVRSGKADTALFSSFHQNKMEKEKAESLIQEMGITAIRNKSIGELSGGQMQRVAIARSLMMKPRLILADEPTGNLDSETGASILRLLRQTCTDTGTTIVMVTHDRAAAQVGDRILWLKDGQLIRDESVETTPRMAAS
jgi:zinc transport system ATP-binding protein